MSLFLELVDPKIICLIKVLLSYPEEHFHIQKLAQRAKVPLSSTHRLVNRLVKLGIIEITTIGKFKIYKLNEGKKIELQTLLGKTR